MSQLLWRLLDVMRLRSGPQDLPAGLGLAVLAALIFIGQGFFADRILDENGNVPRNLIAFMVQLLVTAGLLRFRGLSARLPQTVTALAGTGLIFSIMALILVLQLQPDTHQPGLAFIWFGMFLWSLSVDGHIYRHAMSITMSMGVLVAVLIFALNFIVLEQLLKA